MCTLWNSTNVSILRFDTSSMFLTKMQSTSPGHFMIVFLKECVSQAALNQPGANRHRDIAFTPRKIREIFSCEMLLTLANFKRAASVHVTATIFRRLLPPRCQGLKKSLEPWRQCISGIRFSRLLLYPWEAARSRGSGEGISRNRVLLAPNCKD